MNASRNPVNRVNRLAEISRTGVRWLIHYEGAARSIGKALFPRMHAASEVEFQILAEAPHSGWIRLKCVDVAVASQCGRNCNRVVAKVRANVEHDATVRYPA